MFLIDRFELEHKKLGLVSTLCVDPRLKRVNTVQPSALLSQDTGHFGFSKLGTLGGRFYLLAVLDLRIVFPMWLSCVQNLPQHSVPT